ncbi:Sec23/Sec24 trunk domain containing protein [Trichomonas vaginalis G3]|uniref:Sec23/Sec24 trunk domain containing protein n=1 Tax=Trichomonas vaginalis (strain ATCC PRA-98 / G3) TaxID=412133 RepID=A2D7D6_TRIV3|nr:ER to Golgi vesicle-mediated transport [Trichomonas vaginalis G3]EAY23653.1 Sec23/Sec24 trunk domain containing protein [Trichomonas vaginalis G3]KAI5490145.1 ER to Golgi vesicle-mediated transport [Trichomonas vaginalis G3]|eukprot:XP_001276901.1 Sec23/Sec24 trunk domain containing protein [Trichomonas vaginalis G3]
MNVQKPNTEIQKDSGDSTPWDKTEILNPTTFPSYFRPTIKTFPRSTDLYIKSGIPLGITIEPAKVQVEEVGDLSQSNILKCNRCGSFFNSWCRLINDKTWVCPVCNHENILVSADVVLSQRPEKKSQVVDLLAPPLYAEESTRHPTFLFMFDVSQESISLNIPQLAAQSILTNMSYIDDNMNVSIILFSDIVTVYDLNLMKKTSYVELEEMEIQTQPTLLKDSRSNFEKCLKEIVNITNGPKGNCFGSAIYAASQVLDKTGGIIFSFVASSPSIGPYRIIPRSGESVSRGIDMFRPNTNGNNNFYQTMALKFSKSDISVTLFSFTTTNEVATLGILPALTGGRCFYYPATQETIKSDSMQFYRDIFNCLTDNYMWNTSIVMNLPNTINLKMIHGNLIRKDRHIIAAPAFSAKDSITIEFSIEGHIIQPYIVVQFAFIFTDLKILRRKMRIFTFCINATSSLDMLVNCIDEVAACSLILKRGISAILSKDILYGKDSIKTDATRMLSLSKSFSASNLILRGIISNDLFTVNRSITYDWRMTTIISLRACGVIDSLLFSYPRLLDSENKLRRLRPYETSNPPLVLHMWDRIVVFALTYDKLLEIVKNPNENDKSLDLQNFVDEKFRKIIENSFEISGKSLPVFCVIGGTNFEKYLIEGRLQDDHSANLMSFAMKK